MVLPRLSSCQLWAAPLPITSSTWVMSSPAFWPKAMASLRPCTRPAMQTWLTILVSWPAPLSPISVKALEKAMPTGLMLSNAAASPPHITVRMPFCAPAWPPDTGASMKCSPSCLAAAWSSRATSAEAVVWSTITAPGFMPAKAPSGPSVTERRSSSLPTQLNTTSAPAAARRGKGALDGWAVAENSAHQAVDLAGLRLYTVT